MQGRGMRRTVVRRFRRTPQRDSSQSPHAAQSFGHDLEAAPRRSLLVIRRPLLAAPALALRCLLLALATAHARAHRLSSRDATLLDAQRPGDELLHAAHGDATVAVLV